MNNIKHLPKIKKKESKNRISISTIKRNLGYRKLVEKIYLAFKKNQMSLTSMKNKFYNPKINNLIVKNMFLRMMRKTKKMKTRFPMKKIMILIKIPKMKRWKVKNKVTTYKKKSKIQDLISINSVTKILMMSLSIPMIYQVMIC